MQHRSVRAIVALLVVFGYLSVAVAAVSPGHLHSAQSPHSCAVCQVSLTPFDGTVSGPSIFPPEITDHGIDSVPLQLHPGWQIDTGSSRAPPAA
jgi:hypothetical protein